MTSGSQPAAVDRQRPQAGSQLGVVHLVRRANGLEPFRGFLDSYRRHAGGVEHELVLVLKGFDEPRSSEPYRELAEDLAAGWLSVPDDGFDLGAYRHAAAALAHHRLLLLNSFSVILADGWLDLLAAAARAPRVGAVAASGSWGSQSSHLRYGLGLGGPYKGVFADRRSTDGVFAELAELAAGAQPAGDAESPRGAQSASSAESLGGAADQPRRKPIGTGIEIVRTMARQAVCFPAFPSPHLRTNGLLIERARWLRVCARAPRDKLAAHRLESGRGGITARLRAEGMEAVVVGRDGHSYDAEEWPASRTFWQGDQENLLIGDNQTRAYHDGDALRRRVLAGYAWGPSGAPSEPARAVPA